REQNSLYLKNDIIKYYTQFSSYQTNKTNFLNSINSDCTVFNQKKILQNNLTVMCTNGDAIIYRKLDQTKNNQKKSKKSLIQFNDDYINYVNSLIDYIKNHNIKPIVILEPIYQNHYQYELERVKKILHTNNIIDLTNYQIDSTLWADPQHLNNQGRVYYSNYLAKLLKSEFKF
ncbi:MAG: hypothetical protein JXQ76_05420, partial [Campylobacterales bacterium]|nr:hypothetical protein [Campylobacterales bacterium]